MPGLTPEKTARPLASLTYVGLTLLAASLLSWWWTLSGTPLYILSLALGEYNGYRVLAHLPLWAVAFALNATYAVASTSWILYWFFVAMVYPATLLSCIFQFRFAARLMRRYCRAVLREFHFVQDSISLFDLPALEIDADSVGLFVVRGLTFSLSTLTATAYGIEVGVKLSDDMELAIQTDKAVVALFRRITVGDVFANVKGREEMTFSDVQPFPNVRDMSKDEFIARDTQILKVAWASKNEGLADIKDQLGEEEAAESDGLVRKLSPVEEKAEKEVERLTQKILTTSTSYLARKMLKKIAKERSIDDVLDTETNLHAAVCTHIHDQPSVAHPPTKSIRLSTLAHNNHPKFKKFLHRLPLLYRLLLNPISYFHPIKVSSVTTAGSGKWFVSLMKHHFFKHYSTSDAEVRRLEGRISAWLADANFAVGLSDLFCTGHVPVDTDYDIECKFQIGDLMAHRTLPEAANLTQVVHLGGADATFILPSFLLPHHEHLFPPVLTDFEELQLQQQIEEAKGTPQAVRMQKALLRRQRDETCMKIAVHGHLPALFDQELLNFVAATVKATKVIESEKGHEELVLKRAATDKDRLELEIRRADSVASNAESRKSIKDKTSDSASVSSSAESDAPSAADTETSQASAPGSALFSSATTITPSAPTTSSSPRSSVSFGARINQGLKVANSRMKDGWRKAGIQTVNVVANDRWIASIVGKIMRKLEKAQGDVGYSGLIPLGMGEYRERAELEGKILP